MAKTHLQCADGLAGVSEIRLCIQDGHSVLVIMRGAPGSGKSHLASELAALRSSEGERGPSIHSTDEFFISPTSKKYCFDPSRLEEFHKKNLKNAKESMEQNKSPVIIDNTNMLIEHMKPYIAFGLRHSYEIFILEPDTPWKNNPSELAKRNKHGVDEMTIYRTLGRYEAISHFRDLIRPTQLVVQRVIMDSEDEELEPVDDGEETNLTADNQDYVSMPDEESETAIQQDSGTMTDVSLLSGLTGSVSGIGSDSGGSLSGSIGFRSTSSGRSSDMNNLVPSPTPPLRIGTPPGLPSLGLMPALFSLAPEAKPKFKTVHRREVFTQTSEIIGALIRADLPINDESNPNREGELFGVECTSDLEVPVEKEILSSRDLPKERGTNCMAPACDDISVLLALFPAEEQQSVEHMNNMLGFVMTAHLLSGEMGVEIDRDAIPTQILLPSVALTPTRVSKAQNSPDTSRDMDDLSSFPPLGIDILSANDATVKNDRAPNSSVGMAAAFEWNDEVAIDFNQPVNSILEVFFGSSSPTEQVSVPIWLLELLKKAATGEEISIAELYRHEYPGLGLDEEERRRREQEESDAALARRLHEEESVGVPKVKRTVAEELRMSELSGRYPGVNIGRLVDEAGSVAQAEKTLFLAEQEGLPCREPQLLPASVLAPPSSKSSRVARPARVVLNGNGVQSGRNLADAYLSDVKKMAMKNSKISVREMSEEAYALHDEYTILQGKVDGFIRKCGELVGKRDTQAATSYYVQEIRQCKCRMKEIKKELEMLISRWNECLDENAIDLHFLHADSAMTALRRKIDEFFPKNASGRQGGRRKLTVITGAGNNSQGGISSIRQRVHAFLKTSGYLFSSPNLGSFVVEAVKLGRSA